MMTDLIIVGLLVFVGASFTAALQRCARYETTFARVCLFAMWLAGMAIIGYALYLRVGSS